MKLNVPKPSTFCGELKLMFDEVTSQPPVNVSLADVTVPARLRLAALLSINRKPGLAVNVQVRAAPPPEQRVCKERHGLRRAAEQQAKHGHQGR